MPTRWRPWPRRLRPKSPSTTARPLRSFRALRAHPPLEQRGPGQLIDYTTATLDKSFAVYREGDRDQAYDLSVAAYLEGFVVESSLDNVDADLRRSTEQLMAYRQALRDGLPETQVAQQLERPRASWQRPPSSLAATR